MVMTMDGRGGVSQHTPNGCMKLKGQVRVGNSSFHLRCNQQLCKVFEEIEVAYLRGVFVTVLKHIGVYPTYVQNPV